MKTDERIARIMDSVENQRKGIMKRSAFIGGIAALFGLKASGQQWKECVPDQEAAKRYGLGGTGISICSDKLKPALNGQCPVCGTMAEPWKRPMAAGIKWVTDSHGDNRAITGDMPYGPTDKVVRCKTCNAAFYQDADD